MDKINSELIVERVQRATGNVRKEEKHVGKWIFYPSPLNLFDQLQICSRLDLMSNPSLDSWTEFGVDCMFVRLSVSISVGATWTSITSGRALHCCRKNAFNSTCLILRVEPLRLIIPSAAKESQDKICCFVSLSSSAVHPNFNQRVPLLSQAHAFTSSGERSNQLIFTIDHSSCSRTCSRPDSTNPYCASCDANLCSYV